MARTWLSVTVELIGGRGEELWPYPGRVFAVGPAHTFVHLADAINDAFARWDRAHLSTFTLADGRVLTDADSAAELAASPDGPLRSVVDMASLKVARTVAPGEEFQFTFDLGDAWTHRCTVAAEKVDPVQTLGIRPTRPLPYWGWGAIPDQYGRRWEDDDGEGSVPTAPAHAHPMLLGTWPGAREVADVDMTAVRRAVATGDVRAFVEAVTGCDVDDALQQLADGVRMLWEHRHDEREAITASVANRLAMRDAPGDAVLRDELVSLLRETEPVGHPVPVDLDALALVQAMDADVNAGGYVDLVTGDVYPDSAADPDEAGDDAIDVEGSADRWLWFDVADSRDGWDDMAAFAAQQPQAGLRERLQHAIEGKGAFRRFRDLVSDENLGRRWETFATDRAYGRCRALLADEGVRVIARARAATAD